LAENFFDYIPNIGRFPEKLTLFRDIFLLAKSIPFASKKPGNVEERGGPMATAQELAKRRRKSWETCLEAASAIRSIADELEEYSGTYEEVTALRKQLGRIEKACVRGKSAYPSENSGADGDSDADSAFWTPPVNFDADPKTVAQNVVAQLPLQRIFQDQELSDAFLSELMLALARESSYKNRRERQKEGIEQAKAQGVRFGKPSHPLPDNFEEVRQAWRDGLISMKEAASQCGMARTTFYNAALRAEKKPPMDEEPAHAEVAERLARRRQEQPLAHIHAG